MNAREESGPWNCEDCGWDWPLLSDPIETAAECEKCGGMLISVACGLCEKVPHELGDCFCAPCRVEVTAMLTTVNDPVEHVLSRHWHLCSMSDDDSTMCRCGKRFDGGRGFHRRHLAEEIYKALGLDEPMPWTPYALEIGDES